MRRLDRLSAILFQKGLCKKHSPLDRGKHCKKIISDSSSKVARQRVWQHIKCGFSGNSERCLTWTDSTTRVKRRGQSRNVYHYTLTLANDPGSLTAPDIKSIESSTNPYPDISSSFWLYHDHLYSSCSSFSFYKRAWRSGVGTLSWTWKEILSIALFQRRALSYLLCLVWSLGWLPIGASKIISWQKLPYD